MDKSITHQAIVQLSEVTSSTIGTENSFCCQGLRSAILFFSLQEVTALKQEIIPLKKKLEPYMDLSPVWLFSVHHTTAQQPNVLSLYAKC